MRNFLVVEWLLASYRDLTDIIQFIVIDERGTRVDQIGQVKPKSKKENLISKLLDLTEGNLADKR